MAAIAAYRIWKHALLWLGVLLLLLVRVPPLWSSGEFVSEDGWVFFAGAFNAPWFESIVTPFAGYFRLDARLIAEVVSVLPWAWQPYVYAGVALSLNAFIFSLIYLPGFRRVASSDASRVAIVLLLALSPNAENLGLLTGQHWYLGYALALLLLLPAPSTVAGRIAVGVGASVCAWSSPSALVLIPFWVWRGLSASDRFTQRLSAVVVGQLILYAIAMLVFRGTEGTRSAAFALPDLIAAAGNLLGRGWLLSGLVGRGVSEDVVVIAPLLADALALGLLIAIGYLLFRMPRSERTAPATLLGAGVLMALFSLTRTLYLSELAELELPRHVRYLTTPSLLLIVGFWLMLLRWHSARWLKAIFAVQAIALGMGITHESHWARTPETFRFRDQMESIESFERNFVDVGVAGSLYLPNDIPYWGPVLESAGGVLHAPEGGILEGLNVELNAEGIAHSWMGAFRVLEAPDQIDHDPWGQLTYTGTEQGRVWFVDRTGHQWFTSELLYPKAWYFDDSGMGMHLVEFRD